MTLAERFARAERSQHAGTTMRKTSFPALVMIQKNVRFTAKRAPKLFHFGCTLHFIARRIV